MTCKFPQNTPLTAYKKGCRCERCVIAKREYMAEYNAKRCLTPEQKAKRAEAQAKYRSKPENKKKRAEYNAEYSAKPENKARKAERDAERNAKPENKKALAERDAERHAKYPLYARYNNMISRCTNPNKTRYKDYGGRGIKVCDEWVDSYSAYEAYMMALPGFDLELQIDRIDNDGNYEPGNVRWVTRKVNMNNRERRGA